MEKEEGTGTDAFRVDHFIADMLKEDTMLKIFSFLRDEDLATCSRAHSALHNCLKNQRTRFLLPEVAPLILKQMPKETILECRKVGRSFRAALDNAYQSHPQHLQIHSNHGKSKEDLPELDNYFQSANEIKKFLHEMESHSGNPFPGRMAYFELDDSLYKGNDNRRNKMAFCLEYWNSVIQLLHVFGNQIHFVTINFDTMRFINYNELVNMDVVNILQRCLERLPKVKKLRVQEDDTCDFNSQVEKRVRKMNLQKLLDLETVELVGLPISLTKSILEFCCESRKIKQVAILSMYKWTRLTNTVYRFRNIEVLDTVIKSEDFIAFKKLKRLPPLKKLVISFKGPDKTVQRIFKHLEIFKETLEKVELYMTNMDKQSIGFRVNLPKLESLIIECYEGNLDPFIKLPSLKNLHLGFSGGRLAGQNVVDFYGFENKMETSNIWVLIPSLQTLRIQGIIIKPNEKPIDKKYRRTNQGVIFEKFDDNEEEARQTRATVEEMGFFTYLAAHVMKNIK